MQTVVANVNYKYAKDVVNINSFHYYSFISIAKKTIKVPFFALEVPMQFPLGQRSPVVIRLTCDCAVADDAVMPIRAESSGRPVNGMG